MPANQLSDFGRSVARLRYSTRALILAFTIIGIGAAYFGVQLKNSEQQRIAVSELLAVKGHVSYGIDEESWVEGSWPGLAPAREQALLRRWLGNDFFETVTRVTFSDSRVVDGQFERFKEPPKIVTDDDLVHLSVLTGLQSVCLYQTDITDQGLVHLENLTELKWLILEGTNVTEDGIAALRQALPNCKIIY